MDSLPLFLGAMVLGSAVAIGVDAHRLGSTDGRALANGVSDLGVPGYVIFCLFLWLLAVPYYALVARPALIAQRRLERTDPRPAPTFGGRSPRRAAQNAV